MGVLALTLALGVCLSACERLTVLKYRMQYGVEIFKVEVDGDSMLQTLHNEDIYFARRTENGEGVARGDIIVVYVGDYAEFGSTEFLVKRLIATEGDRVKCADGQIEICYAGETEWTELDEPYAYYMDKAADDFAEYAVGEGEVFFLGDNRNNSLDSRYHEGCSRLDTLFNATDIYGVLLDVEEEWKSAENS